MCNAAVVQSYSSDWLQGLWDDECDKVYGFASIKVDFFFLLKRAALNRLKDKSSAKYHYKIKHAVKSSLICM